jgi:hypothetical protein
MQDIYKNGAICEAIKKSIADFGKDNALNGMEFFADQLGFKGDNKAAQLHNRLSPSNNEKFLKLDEMRFMMKQMSKPQQKHIIDALANEFGFYVAEGAEGKPIGSINIEAVISMGVLDVGGTYGALSEEALEDLKDGSIDDKEALRLKKTLKELREKARGIEDMLDKHVLGQ